MTEHGHGHGHGHAQPHQGDYSTELLDLDAAALSDHLSGVLDWVAGHLGDHPVRRIVDLGAGTGTGTFALLGRFGDATVTALDASDSMLEHLTHRAKHLGLDDRITPVQVDLDHTAVPVETADLVWASAAMHHLAHPERVLGELRPVLAPSGRFAMIEFESFPRFLPAEFGHLEERLNAIADRMREEHHPTVGSDWSDRLTASGFAVTEARTFEIDLPTPLSDLARRYARVTLERLRQALGDRLDDADRTTLDALLSEGALENRDDLTVRTSRRAWIAQPLS